jgi:hypothetical protein
MFSATRFVDLRHLKPPQASILSSIFGIATALRNGEVLGTWGKKMCVDDTDQVLDWYIAAEEFDLFVAQTKWKYTPR